LAGLSSRLVHASAHNISRLDQSLEYEAAELNLPHNTDSKMSGFAIEMQNKICIVKTDIPTRDTIAKNTLSELLTLISQLKKKM